MVEKKRARVIFSCIVCAVNICVGYYLPYAVFQYTSMALQLVLLLFGALQMPILYFLLPQFIKRIKSKFQVVLIVLLFFYIGFAVVGNYLFVYPVHNFSLSQALCYLLAVLWCAPLCVGILEGFCLVMEWKPKSNDLSVKHKRITVAACFVFIVLVGVLYIAGYNPAITSYDTLNQIQQAKGILPLSNWQTPFHTLLLRVLLFIIDSPSFVALCQWMFFGMVWCSLVAFLLEKKVPVWLCITLTVAVVLTPANAVQLTTLWKDIPYCITLLWSTLLLAKVVIDAEKVQKKKSFYIQIVAVLALQTLLRQNGIIPFIMTIAVLLLLLRKNKKVWLSVATAILLVVMVVGPIFTVLDVAPADNPNGKYIGLGYDILHVYMAGGEMSPEAMIVVDGFLQVNDIENYNPYYAYLRFQPDESLTMGTFLLAYIKTALQNPVSMIRAILYRIDCSYNVFLGRNGFLNLTNYTKTMDSYPEWAQMYSPHTPNTVTKVLSGWGSISMAVGIRWITWRTGFSTILLLCGCMAAILKNRKKLLFILIPWAGQFLSILLSTAWADFRYYWPLNVCSLVF